MKLSNFMLTFVAVSALVGSIAASALVLSTNPTSVLTFKTKDDQQISIVLTTSLSENQTKNISLAYEIGKKDGLSPALLPAIILKETLAGDYHSYKVAGQEFGLAANQRYYGLAQIKLAAAKDVLQKWPSLWDEFNFHTKTDEEIIAKLIENNRFNLQIASKYLLILQKYGFDTNKKVALAYNQGPGGARNFDSNTHQYSVGVMRYMQSLAK